MKKLPIGILDMGIEGISVLKEFSNKFKYEDIIYINDFRNYPYEGRTEEDINTLVKAKVELLLKYNIKLLVVVSDCIIEYCTTYLNSLPIPVVNIVNSLIEFTNDNFELKNMVLLAKQSILEANMYQKNFKYNHLYNISADGLVEVMDKNEIKTSESFYQANIALSKIARRDLDVLICSSPYLTCLKTEFLEFAKIPSIINVGEVLAEKTWKLGKEFYQKGKGKRYIVSYLDKKTFQKMISWLDITYKYITLDQFIENSKKKTS